MEENSVITLYRRTQLARVTSGAISTLPPITHVAFGTGGTDANGEPIQPLPTATALNREAGRYGIGEIAYPESTTVRYKVTIPAGDLVGEKVNEAALVDGAGKVCAVKTFYDKRKDAGVSLSFAFDDKF